MKLEIQVKGLPRKTHTHAGAHEQTKGRDDIPTCPQLINNCPHVVMEVVSVAGLKGSEREQTLCLITVRGVIVLPAAKVDLWTLDPALISHGIYLTERKKNSYSCATWTVLVTRQETVANGLKCH